MPQLSRSTYGLFAILVIAFAIRFYQIDAYGLYIDEKGIYWVGSFQGGVSKYDKNLAFFNLVQS